MNLPLCHLSIEHLKETSHLQISVKSLDSKEAAEIVDSLIVAYSEEEIKHALGPPPPNLDSASKKLGISLEKLESALFPN